MICGAELHIADDHGDNHATIRCQLDKGHAGPHMERFQRNGTDVVIRFECDERPKDGFCGKPTEPYEYCNKLAGHDGPCGS